MFEAGAEISLCTTWLERRSERPWKMQEACLDWGPCGQDIHADICILH